MTEDDMSRELAHADRETRAAEREAKGLERVFDERDAALLEARKLRHFLAVAVVEANDAKLCAVQALGQVPERQRIADISDCKQTLTHLLRRLGVKLPEEEGDTLPSLSMVCPSLDAGTEEFGETLTED